MSAPTIGSCLRNRRRDLSIDQSDAAARIGMSRTTFSSYERDLQRPSAEVLPALAQFLEVTIEEMLILYGATCIEAMRPALERFLASHGAETKGVAVVALPAHAEPLVADAQLDDDAASVQTENVQEVPSKEVPISTFDNDFSDATPMSVRSIAISPDDESSSPGGRQLDKPKKKKKKKGRKK
jgi:transcriptional regulator with XRE-family HTH domain